MATPTAAEHTNRSTSTTTSHHFLARADFKQEQASRPEFNRNAPLKFSQPPNINWKQGDGANDKDKDAASPLNEQKQQKQHIQIDPNEPGRPSSSNYKLLISGIVPRPIAFVSTRSQDGASVNLAPFSYFQMVNHDPPMFVVSFVGSVEKAKDTLKNLLETKECVINLISEHFVEAANATSVNAPYGVSEFEIAGLQQAECATVKAPRVQESIFSIEGRLVETREFESKVRPGQKTGCLAIVEGTRFWVREDAINEERDLIDLEVLRPMSRLGGIRYGRTTEVVELERPSF